MQVRMPNVPANLAPPELVTENTTYLAPQNTISNASTNSASEITAAQPLVAAPPTSTAQQLQLLSISAPLEAIQQNLRKLQKEQEKYQNFSRLTTIINLANLQTHVPQT